MNKITDRCEANTLISRKKGHCTRRAPQKIPDLYCVIKVVLNIFLESQYELSGKSPTSSYI